MSRERAGGIVIGRFMPPHDGHRYLIDFARSFCADLTVFVCTLRSEPIPGELRFRWMQELFPAVTIVHITEEIPEAARSQAGAHEIWADSIRRHTGTDPEYVFASEEYGVGLAAALGARFVPVDPRRALFPVSAAMIRSDPLAHWEYLPEQVRPYFVCRISVAEHASGRAASDRTRSVAEELAGRFGTIHVADYRTYHDELGYPAPAIETGGELVSAQLASETALRSRANRVLFLENDLLHSIIESRDPEVRQRFSSGGYDDALEANRPDAVITIGPPDPAYRRETERRGWGLHEVPAAHADPVAAAEEIARTILSRHWKNS